jgi:hypothetical protein
MWSDMFFRLANHGEYYVKGVHIPEEVRSKVPENVDLCYWDYGEHELTEEMFDEMFRQHEEFGRELWFAGGAWCWDGFAPFNRYSLASMKLAMKQVVKHSVRNVFITLWGGRRERVFLSLNASRLIRDQAIRGRKFRRGKDQERLL